MKLEHITEAAREVKTSPEGDEFVETQFSIEAVMQFSHDPAFTQQFEQLMGHEAFQKALRIQMNLALRNTFGKMRFGGEQWTDDHQVLSINTGPVVN